MSVVRVSLSKLRDQALNVGRPTADTSNSEPCTQLFVNIHKLHPITEGQHCSNCKIHITSSLLTSYSCPNQCVDRSVCVGE